MTIHLPMPLPGPQKKPAGFTLIEMMVTITVLSIVMMLALPSFTQWSRNSKLRSTAENVQNGIRMARTHAMNTNRTVVFSLTTLEPKINVAADAAGLNWTIQTIPMPGDDPDETYVRGGNFGGSDNKLKITSTATPTATGTATLCFNSIGQLTNVALPGTGVPCTAQITTFAIDRGSDTVAGKDRPLSVQVSLAGRARMCDPNRSSPSPDAC